MNLIFTTTLKGGDITFSILQMMELNHRQVKPLGHGHSVKKWRTQDQNQKVSEAWEPKLYAILHHCVLFTLGTAL